MVAEQAALIESLRAEVAALRRQAGRDSSNSSQPPSQDGPAAEAKAGSGRRGGRGRAGRRAGRKAIRVRAWRGPPGRMRPWSVEPGTCGGCGADLAGAAGPGRVQRAGASISRRPR